MAQWYVSRDGQQHGPYDDKTLRDLAAQGRLVPTDYVWREGMGDWAPASKLKGLFPDQESKGTRDQHASTPQQQAVVATPRSASGAQPSADHSDAGESNAQSVSRYRADGTYRSSRMRRRMVATREKIEIDFVRYMPMISAIALLALLIIPFHAVGSRRNTTLAWSWNVFFGVTHKTNFRSMEFTFPTMLAILLAVAWLAAIALIVVHFVTKGFARKIAFASVGGAAGLMMLISLFALGPPSPPFHVIAMDRVSMEAGEKFVVLFKYLFLLATLIGILVQGRLGTNKAMRITQLAGGGGLALMALIHLIMHVTENTAGWKFAGFNRDHYDAFRILMVTTELAACTAGVFALIQAILNRGTGLSKAALWVIGVSIIELYGISAVYVMIASETFVMAFSQFSFFVLFGGMLMLFGSTQILLLEDLLPRLKKKAADQVSKNAELSGGGKKGDASKTSDAGDIEAKFEKLKQLLEHGHITQEQYEKKRAALLDQI